ncbi:MAG: tol-pal system protein YbgF, partial [Endozoicomonadaceae bacterium]|nr:tol-pal system protein YbgF [Endozoicomonadaceae bacterium]
FLSHRNYQQNSRDTDKNNRLIISDFSLSLINIQTKINLLKEELKMQKRMTEQLKLQLEEYYKNLSTRLSLLELKEKKPPSDTPPSAESIEKSEPSLLSDKRSADDAVAYNNALTLTREQKFQEAIAAFNNFILKYSQSQHVPDALYWLGEIYSATGKVEQAKEVFFKIIDKYPQGDPCADAMYKYAIILAQSGDRENAVAYLHKVVEKYPLKSVAELAKRYLKLLN